jgi:hypothetical protein
VPGMARAVLHRGVAAAQQHFTPTSTRTRWTASKPATGWSSTPTAVSSRFARPQNHKETDDGPFATHLACRCQIGRPGRLAAAGLGTARRRRWARQTRAHHRGPTCPAARWTSWAACSHRSWARPGSGLTRSSSSPAPAPSPAATWWPRPRPTATRWASWPSACWAFSRRRAKTCPSAR